MKLIKEGDGYLEFDSIDNPRMKNYDGKLVEKIVKKNNGNVQVFLKKILKEKISTPMEERVDSLGRKIYNCEYCGVFESKTRAGILAHERTCKLL